MNSKMLVSTTLLCLLALVMGASNEADTCTIDSSGHNQCQDKSSLLQAKVIVNDPLAVEAPALDELEAPTSDGSDPDKGGSGDGTDSVHNPTHEKVYTENEHTRETDKECKDFNEMSACGAAGCAWEQGACVEEASNQTANSLLAKVDGRATNQVDSEKGCRRRRAHRRRRSRSLAATGECAKACAKLGSCHKRWRQYRPLNMAGQGRTKEASVNACQQRCGRTKGCAYFSFWRDGGCHIQDSKAQARAGCCGVKSGPASCESSTKKTGAGSAPAAAPAAGPPKCWRKMPTGCAKRLSEAGSQGTGLNWFIDTGSTNSARCTARAADFNRYCGKSDAMTKWGSKPSAGTPTPAPTQAPAKKKVSKPKVTSPPCGFETSAAPYCGTWSNAKGDQFDWTRKSGRTPTSRTGPSSAHSGNHYMYIEASFRRGGDTAILQSVSTTFSAGAWLSFQYHMFGPRIGTLKVVFKQPSGAPVIVWQKNANKGNKWHKADIDLSSIAGKTGVMQLHGIIIRKCASFLGDIAIDEISLTAGSGNASPAAPAPAGGAPAAPAPAAGAPASPGLFGRMDADKSGIISKEEFNKALAAAVITEADLFDRMDADKSGTVSTEEFNKAIAAAKITGTLATPVKAAAPVSPSFSFGNTGSKSCPTGTSLSDETTCKAAAAQLGLVWKTSFNAATWPNGCFERTDGQHGANGKNAVFFNLNSGSSHALGRPICSQASPSPPPAKPTSAPTSAPTPAPPAAGPPKCWRKMPTGCGKTLSEAGSQGTGLNWFIDTIGSTNSARCTARAADFNIHCGKSDAMTKWGSKPTAGSAPAAPASAPTTAPKAASSAGPLFNRIDKNGDNSITEGEFNKASAAGTITVKA